MKFITDSLKKLSTNPRVIKAGAGIRAVEVSDDWRYAKVSMPLRWYNKNYVGTHFGGNLFSMTDCLQAVMLMNVLGKEFVVWDQAASIQYKTPGREEVTVEFCLNDDLIDSLQTMDPEEKKLLEVPLHIKDASGNVVAEVNKTIYVRRRKVVNHDANHPAAVGTISSKL